jgi:hypothetical protein
MTHIEIERDKLERTMMLLAVATFHTPSLQAQRTELVEAGLKALTAPVQEPVALDVTIDDDDALAYLRDMVVQSDGDLTPIRLIVGDWHSGRGLYVFSADYPDEGGVKIADVATTPPEAQRQRVVFPTMLRKMWSGGEVQAWLDENVNKENT